MASTQRILTCLWYDTEAEEAAGLYVSLMQGPDREASGRVMAAMLKMVKLDIPQLEVAYAGR